MKVYFSLQVQGEKEIYHDGDGVMTGAGALRSCLSPTRKQRGAEGSKWYLKSSKPTSQWQTSSSRVLPCKDIPKQHHQWETKSQIHNHMVWEDSSHLVHSTINSSKSMEMKEANLPFRMTFHLSPLNDISETLARTQGSGLWIQVFLQTREYSPSLPGDTT